MTKIRNQKAIADLGKRLKAARKEKGLSIYALANIADVERSQIMRIENGKSNPTISTLLAVAGALDLKLRDLLENY